MGQILSALGEVNGTEEDLNLRCWEDLAGFKFPNPICKDPQNLVGFRVDAATVCVIKVIQLLFLTYMNTYTGGKD